MKVTLQQKLLGGVLVIGAIALSADRLFFLKSASSETSQTSGATASEYAIAPAARVQPAIGQPVALRAATANAVAVVSIAERLREAMNSSPTTEPRDAFTIGAGWPAATEAATETPAGVSAAETFKQTHRLTGVLSSNGRSLAMVDGKLVAVGQSVDGYRLAAISHRSATFEAANSQVTLNMTERTSGPIAGAGQ